MNKHDKLVNVLLRYIEQPEPTTKGHSFIVRLSDLANEYEYIDFHIDDETDELTVRVYDDD